MKSNKTIFALLLFVISSMLFSCDKKYGYCTEIRIENTSQYNIEIVIPKLWLDGIVLLNHLILHFIIQLSSKIIKLLFIL